jgi:RimJ/RimL family protein N-acetyltransferase
MSHPDPRWAAFSALGPVTLSGSHVRLEPLRHTHLDRLVEAAVDERIWVWLPKDLRPAAEMVRFIDEAIAHEEQGQEYAFAVVALPSQEVVGTTCYLDVTPSARGVEIGWTWYSPRVWGTSVNPEAKLLLMRHAFEGWGAIRVYFKTDMLNERSRAALEKLGASFEGALRNHRIRRDGSYRASAVYSVIAEEWPDVEAGLLERLRREEENT